MRSKNSTPFATLKTTVLWLVPLFACDFARWTGPNLIARKLAPLFYPIHELLVAFRSLEKQNSWNDCLPTSDSEDSNDSKEAGNNQVFNAVCILWKGLINIKLWLRTHLYKSYKTCKQTLTERQLVSWWKTSPKLWHKGRKQLILSINEQSAMKHF